MKDDTAPTRVHPTQDDAVVAGLSESVGGPMGSRAGRHSWWSPVRVLLVLTALTFALGLVAKTPCVNSQWQDTEQRYTHMCYSDMPYLYTWRGLADLNWPYTDDAAVRAEYEVMEYPAGISYWAWGTGHVTWWLSGTPDLDAEDRDLVQEGTLYFAVNALGFALVALLTTWLMAGVNRRRPWDAAGFALAPALALTATVNWDLLAVVFVAGAAWAWARERPLLTGVMIGLGTAVKLYPLFLLGAVLVICLRSRRWRTLALTAAAAGGAWLLANAPALLTGPAQWKVFWSFNSERAADLGSVWLVAQQMFDTWFEVETVNLGSWVFFILWCVGVLALGWQAPVSPRFAQLGFLIVAGFLLVNKVYSPQYVLWLLPLAVLARPRWRDLLIWQAGEVIYFAAVWWYLAEELTPAGDGAPVIYWLAIALRLAAQLWLVAVVARDVMRPEKDPVERPPEVLQRSHSL
ncbi:glycosyltransferase family 87 protein [Nocardioides gilvus]|uniref:glycosyltransferase family 87 protein n=1 Tax=Nocardioides gilvus TaxID=1735589 RepID=UPI001EF673EB|nr:glycosyltransferase 87 family protein [Nocardioides gilvus]